MRKSQASRSKSVLNRVAVLKVGLAAVICLVTSLGWAAGVANDNFSGAQVITGPSGTFPANNTGATAETGEPWHAGHKPQHSIWFQWVAPANAYATFDTLAATRKADLDTVLAVYTGSSVTNLTCVARNDDFDPNRPGPSSVTFLASASTTYYIAVDGCGRRRRRGQPELVGGHCRPGAPGQWPLLVRDRQRDRRPVYVVNDTENHKGGDDEVYPPLQDTTETTPAGAHLRVTRINGADGVIAVNWSVTNILYTNYYYTNYTVGNQLRCHERRQDADDDRHQQLFQQLHPAFLLQRRNASGHRRHPRRFRVLLLHQWLHHHGDERDRRHEHLHRHERAVCRPPDLHERDHASISPIPSTPRHSRSYR